MAKPVEKLTKTAILKRIYRVLELEYMGGAPGCRKHLVDDLLAA